MQEKPQKGTFAPWRPYIGIFWRLLNFFLVFPPSFSRFSKVPFLGRRVMLKLRSFYRYSKAGARKED